MITEKIINTKYSFEYLYMQNGVVKNTSQVISQINPVIENQKFYDFSQESAILLDTNAVIPAKTVKTIIENS